MNEGFNKSTSQSDEWQTPQWLFDSLDSEFGFTFDGAATKENALCRKYATKHDTTNMDADWSDERVFCNPPYSDIETFVHRALWSSAPKAELVVLLLPVRTDSNWHRWLVESKAELRYYRKRISFLQDGQPMKSPRFSTLVAVVNGNRA